MRIRTFILGLFFFAHTGVWAQSSAPKIISIEVDPLDQKALVESIIPLQVGDIYEPSLNDISKRLLIATDRFENVEVQWIEAESKFQVTVRPRLIFDSISWQGEGIPSASEIQRNCIPTNESRDLSQERISQITRCLLVGLQGRGYLDAQVVLSIEGSGLIIQATMGERYSIDSIEWVGVSVFRTAQLEYEMHNRVGEPFLPLYLDSDTREIQKLYLNYRYYFAEVFKPNVQVLPDSKSVKLTWKIEESHQFDIKMKGDDPEDDPIEKIESREETLPKWFADEIVDSIETDFRERGYLDVKVDVQRDIDPETKKETIIFHTRKHDRYLLLDPEFIGVNDREGVAKIYQSIPALRPIQVFEESNIRRIIGEEYTGLLRTSGYLDARLRSLEFVIDAQKHRVKPVLYLQEGDLWTIENVEITGVPEDMQKSVELKDFRSSMKVRGVFDEVSVDQRQAEFQRALIRQGYLDAKIERKIDRGAGSLNIREIVQPGPQYRVARILIHGAVKTKYEVMRREVLLKVGEIYKEDRIQDSIAHILRLGIARSVDIQPMEKNPQRAEVYVLVDLSEANRFRFEFGPGYGTLDGLRATFRGTYANIGGTGRRLTFYSKASRQLGDSELPVGLINPKAIPFVERKATLEYFEPTVLGLQIDGRLLFTHSKQDEKRFGLLRNAFTGAIDYRYSRHWIYTTGYDLEFSDPFNIQVAANSGADQARKKRLTALTEDILVEYVDDSFSPSRGARSKLSLDLYDERLGGNASFWLTSLKQTFYLPIWTIKKNKILGVSFSLNGGFSGPYEDTPEVPVEKRFRVGGENSVRGYGENSINPAGFEGGDSFFSFMSELYIPVVWGIDLLGFFDGGSAFASNGEFHPWDLRYGAGPGIRWNTPVGPLKFGYGFILGRREDAQGNATEPAGHFYFGVGSL